jgi:ribosomal protein L37AE/L43A
MRSRIWPNDANPEVATMRQPAEEEAPVCPECGEELWYDEEYECWVCDTCGMEFYEEDREEEEAEEAEEEEEDKA